MKDMSWKVCPDCGAGVGELHAVSCDVERCPYCGCQVIACLCETTVDFDGVPADDRMAWDGQWPGERECREFGWYCKRGPGIVVGSRVRPDEPNAVADLNRLCAEARWDRERKRFVR